ncbi:MAG: hypothetical protein ACFB9N_17915 [Geitlerinemataceae cyanobacterium]
MRSRAIVPLLALLAVVASGCGGSDAPDAATDPAAQDPTAAAPANVPVAAPTDAADDDGAEPFDSPTVAAAPTSIPAAEGLTASTNPNERAIQVQRQIQSGQGATSNPFGILPVEPVADIPQGALTGTDAASTEAAEKAAAEAAEEAVNLPPSSPLPPLTAQASSPAPDLPFPIVPDVSAIPYVPPEERPVPQIDLTPPPPSTELAETIEVLGVIQVGSEIQVLIRTPNSPTGRYVSVGDTVANGQVLVRRVERLQGGGEPVVILVQNGIEVARGVGDMPSLGDEDMTATAIDGTRRSTGLPTPPSETLVSGLPLPPVPVPYAP